jgi:hypothetical protein
MREPVTTTVSSSSAGLAGAAVAVGCSSAGETAGSWVMGVSGGGAWVVCADAAPGASARAAKPAMMVLLNSTRLVVINLPPADAAPVESGTLGGARRLALNRED